MLRNTKKFHVYKDAERQIRTTVSLDQVVVDLLAIKLGGSSISEYLQAKLDADPDPHRVNTSNWLQRAAILDIAAENLRDAYWDKRIG